MTIEQQRIVREIMDAYANNPSNANKYFYQMLAIIDEGDYGEEDEI